MKMLKPIGFLLFLALTTSRPALAQNADTALGIRLLGGAISNLTRVVVAPESGPARTFTATLKLVKADGLPKDLAGLECQVAMQAPDHLKLSVPYQGRDLTVCRDGQEVWIYEARNKFGVIGVTNAPLFSTNPDLKETSKLGALELPIPLEQLMVMPVLADIEILPDEAVGGTTCKVLKARPKAEAVTAFRLLKFTLQVWLRPDDLMPLRIGYNDGRAMDFQVDLVGPSFADAWPEEKWKLRPAGEDRVETVARAHITRFLSVAYKMLGERVPPLGPATGERQVLAREGNGRLERVDGTRVLYLKGTPEEMGRQHGALMKKEIRELVDHILYGVGVGSSFEKGRWFLGEIESAQKRLTPYMNPRYFREMDAIASAAGLTREEVRLANFFPELFHCSGFAVFGKATEGGRLYHGRILDYLRGMGLEQNAVVMVIQPDLGNAWVNVSYAGFVGSVTAMNAKQIAIGEMGGRGEGNWDGKPMAQLVREVMEKADTLDQAVEIMRKGPRTCEYYYVISDAKTKRAVGIAATPQKFEIVLPGTSHPMLPHAIEDVVLMSAGDRYEALARRVKAAFGKIDAPAARDLMKRPVCMTSNIHSALFAPDSLDFWVANADSRNPAAHARFTQYNLAEMLRPEKSQ
jgi:hypothetical protein